QPVRAVASAANRASERRFANDRHMNDQSVEAPEVLARAFSRLLIRDARFGLFAFLRSSSTVRRLSSHIAAQRGEIHGRAHLIAAGHGRQALFAAPLIRRAEAGEYFDATKVRARQRRDRKSTRLNSSHA